MKSDVVTVYSSGKHLEQGLNQVEAVAEYKKLTKRSRLILRLLAEETLGMMRSITGEQKGEFWIEDSQGEYQIHLVVDTVMDSHKREELLEASTSGRNEAARGLMGTLRDLFERSADRDLAPMTNPMLMAGMCETDSANPLVYEWSMMQCYEELKDSSEPERAKAWDELEKSVVSHVAEEVKVSIRGSRVEMIIYKHLQ